jgi:hypothetical protein
MATGRSYSLMIHLPAFARKITCAGCSPLTGSSEVISSPARRTTRGARHPTLLRPRPPLIAPKQFKVARDNIPIRAGPIRRLGTWVGRSHEANREKRFPTTCGDFRSTKILYDTAMRRSGLSMASIHRHLARSRHGVRWFRCVPMIDELILAVTWSHGFIAGDGPAALTYSL